MIDYNEIHYSVMKRESVEKLNIKPDGIYVDCTCGAGGHSEAIAERLGENGKLICIDEDGSALEIAKKRLERFGDKLTFVNMNFSQLEEIFKMLDVDKIDGAVMDLGVSSMQLRDGERGFAYMIDGPLDMRMDRNSPLSAYDIVNAYDEQDIKRILWEYGEEKFAPRIAEKIAAYRENKKIETTAELVSVIESAVPKGGKGGHPAKRTFQALRIAVNRELDIIEPAINFLIDRMNRGGVIAVISFHSLEDRIVKRAFVKRNGKCTCPPEFPVCVCGAKADVKLLGDETPGSAELGENPPSHSARLRCALRL